MVEKKSFLLFYLSFSYCPIIHQGDDLVFFFFFLDYLYKFIYKNTMGTRNEIFINPYIAYRIIQDEYRYFGEVATGEVEEMRSVGGLCKMQINYSIFENQIFG